MSKEELLRVRYKVMVKYPFSPFNIGAVLEQMDSVLFNIYDDERYEGCEIHINWIKSCPDVFHEMQWWEDRKPEDMPQYVKKHYVDRWLVYDLKDKDHIDIIYRWGFVYDSRLTEATIEFSDCLPATESEYLDHLKQKKL